MSPPAAPTTRRILVADDQPAIRDALRLLLKGEGFVPTLVPSPAEALAAAQAEEFGLAFIDLNYTRDTTSGQEGLDLLGRLLALEGGPARGGDDRVGDGGPGGGGDAARREEISSRSPGRTRGCWRPCARSSNSAASGGATRGWKRRTAPCATTRRRRKTSPEGWAGSSWPRSAAMRPVLETIGSVGPSDAPVLIVGENGTGKGLAARALHAASQRAAKPLVSVNMGGLSENVFESELFGHVRGAFTDAKADRIGRFELADGGTLFLDEIANVPLAQQAKLLRLLETGEFERVGSSRTQRADVRLLSATNADLHAEVAAGRFRQDLLYRLNTVTLRLPPLRDRPEDIPALARFFLQKHVARYRKRLAGLDEGAAAALLYHPWPGNVRELDHAIERAVLLATPRTPCGRRTSRCRRIGAARARRAAPTLEEMSLEDMEKFLIQKAMARHQGKAAAAAEALGLSRSAFYRRLQQYGL